MSRFIDFLKSMVYQSNEILNVPSRSTHLTPLRAGFASRGLQRHSQAIDDQLESLYSTLTNRIVMFNVFLD